MAQYKVLIATIVVLSVTTNVLSKIVLPNKLRYLENMLNSEVVAKAAKLRQQQMEANPNGVQENNDTKMWALLLAKYGQGDKATGDNMYRRPPNFKL
ncbi:hypothetical protein NE865_07250 [Phthorimaea operculella]|nr:hypothetical protein NE865_07250 [Phthorimaea operculella]